MKETKRQFASHEEVYLTSGFSEEVLGFKPILRKGIIWISFKLGVILDRQDPVHLTCIHRTHVNKCV